LHPRSRTLELAWASVTLSHSLGAAYAYANANYDTLGLLVQVVAGQSYEAYVEQHIFAPLRMRNSFTSKVAAEEQGLASSHRFWFGMPSPFDLPYPRGSLPSGYLISSAVAAPDSDPSPRSDTIRTPA